MGSAEGAPMASAASPPRIGRALVHGWRASYDCLGLVLIASALWIGLATLLGAGGSGLALLCLRRPGLTPLLIASLAGIAMAGIGTGPLTAAIFDHARRVMANEEPSWWEFLSRLPLLWRRGLSLAALQVAVSLVLAMDACFFLGQSPLLLRLVGMLFAYPLLFWWGASLLQWPLAVERAEDSMRNVIKKSFLLLLDNLGYLSSLAVVLLALTFLCAVTRIGLMLAWMGVGAFLQTAAFRELLPKYGLLAPPTAEEVLDEA
jgi:uncharacterized membrane protein YesL